MNIFKQIIILSLSIFCISSLTQSCNKKRSKEESSKIEAIEKTSNLQEYDEHLETSPSEKLQEALPIVKPNIEVSLREIIFGDEDFENKERRTLTAEECCCVYKLIPNSNDFNEEIKLDNIILNEKEGKLFSFYYPYGGESRTYLRSYDKNNTPIDTFFISYEDYTEYLFDRTSRIEGNLIYTIDTSYGYDDAEKTIVDTIIHKITPDLRFELVSRTQHNSELWNFK